VEFEEGDVKLVLPSNLSPGNDAIEVLRRVGVMTCGDGSESEWSEGEERREEVWKSYPSVEDGLEGRGLEVELRDKTLYFKIALKHLRASSFWTIRVDLVNLSSGQIAISIHRDRGALIIAEDGHRRSAILEKGEASVEKDSSGIQTGESAA